MSDAPSHNLTPTDLAELMSAFGDVTRKLEATHVQLRDEVARLTRELGEANQQIERSRRLAALGEMAAGIAHEVRNPLGSIRLYARMLVEDLADRLKERAVAEKIGRAASHLDAVVGDVLAFSREFRLRRAPAEVGPLFDAALDASCHDGLPVWKSVRVQRSGDHVEIDADAHLLQQALTNIIRNALEAMGESPAPPGGHRLDLAASSDSNGNARITIRDTGPGIPPEVLSRMFNPFFTTRHTGTGLGLAIVHRIIDAHGGRITVEPARPGSTFTLHIPALHAQAVHVLPHSLATSEVA